MLRPEVDANRANWDERVESHLHAYGAEAFARDSDAVTAVVRDDYEKLSRFLREGSVRGLTLAHLQCHIGTDTLSWARLGAHASGLDFSGEAVAAARQLADRAALPCAFVQSDVTEAPLAFQRTFDVVYTSIGVLPWLHDLTAWAAAVSELLTPGGFFYLRDAHPMLSAIDYGSEEDRLIVSGPYFPTETPMRYDDGTTYADGDVRLSNRVTFEWPHSVSEVVQSLLDAGLILKMLSEERTIPWKALPFLVPTSEGFALPQGSDRLPLTFSLVAQKGSSGKALMSVIPGDC